MFGMDLDFKIKKNKKKRKKTDSHNKKEGGFEP